MTILTEQQQDALTELVNIGFGKTSAALSELTNSQVILHVPNIAIHSIGELATMLRDLVQEDVATVQQIFSGVVSGSAFLLLTQSHALALTNLVSPLNHPPAPQFDASACEVLTEVGNILLNACLGAFGNMLKIQISFSVPRMNLDELDKFVNSIMIGREELRYAMVIYTAFHLRDSSVDGYLIMVLGVSSLDNLLKLVDQWSTQDVSLH